MLENHTPNPELPGNDSLSSRSELREALAEEALAAEIEYLNTAVGQYRPIDFLRELRDTHLVAENGVYEGTLIDKVKDTIEAREGVEEKPDRSLMGKLFSPITDAIDYACDKSDFSNVLQSLRDRNLISVVTCYTTVSSPRTMSMMGRGTDMASTTINSNDYYITPHGRRLLELIDRDVNLGKENIQ